MGVFETVGYVGIILGSILGFGIGAIWYSPKMFSDSWMQSQPWRKESDYQNAGSAMIVEFISTIMVAVIYSVVLVMMGISFVGMFTAYLLVGAYVVAWNVATGLFSGYPKQRTMIDTGYQLVKLLIIAVCIFSFA